MTVTIKTADEQDKMRVAGRLAADVLDMISDYVKPGVTTGELDRICHDYIVQVQTAVPAPLNYKGFPKSICTSVNHQVCHGIPGDKMLKKGDIINIDVTVIVDEGAQDISFERLLRLTGRSYGQISGLADDFPVEYPEPRDEEAWVQAALQNNFDLKAAREAVRSAEKQVHISRAGHYPTVGAQASYSHNVSGGGDFFGSKNNSTNLSLQMSIPVFAGLSTRSRTKQSAYRLDEAQRNFDLTQRTTVETTRNLYSAINTDVARVRARLRAIESSQSALDATETGYEVGTRNIVDVLIAQQRLFAAQFQYASARYQYIMDTLRLKQIVGSLSPQDIYDLNQFIQGNTGIERVKPN